VLSWELGPSRARERASEPLLFPRGVGASAAGNAGPEAPCCSVGGGSSGREAEAPGRGRALGLPGPGAGPPPPCGRPPSARRINFQLATHPDAHTAPLPQGVLSLVPGGALRDSERGPARGAGDPRWASPSGAPGARTGAGPSSRGTWPWPTPPRRPPLARPSPGRLVPRGNSVAVAPGQAHCEALPSPPQPPPPRPGSPLPSARRVKSRSLSRGGCTLARRVLWGLVG